jgi:hypothetical protein
MEAKDTIATVGEMTVAQLKALIKESVEEILREILVDPDAGLQLRPEFEERLRQSLSYVDSGGKPLSFEELKRRLGEPCSV